MSTTIETTMKSLLERWSAVSDDCRHWPSDPEYFNLGQAPHDYTMIACGGFSFDDCALIHAVVLEAVRARGWRYSLDLDDLDDGWRAEVVPPSGGTFFYVADDPTTASLSAYVEALEARDA